MKGGSVDFEVKFQCDIVGILGLCLVGDQLLGTLVWAALQSCVGEGIAHPPCIPISASQFLLFSFPFCSLYPLHFSFLSSYQSTMLCLGSISNILNQVNNQIITTQTCYKGNNLDYELTNRTKIYK